MNLTMSPIPTSLPRDLHAEPPGQVDGRVQEGGGGLLPSLCFVFFFIIARPGHLFPVLGDGHPDLLLPVHLLLVPGVVLCGLKVSQRFLKLPSNVQC